MKASGSGPEAFVFFGSCRGIGFPCGGIQGLRNSLAGPAPCYSSVKNNSLPTLFHTIGRYAHQPYQFPAIPGKSASGLSLAVNLLWSVSPVRGGTVVPSARCGLLRFGGWSASQPGLVRSRTLTARSIAPSSDFPTFWCGARNCPIAVLAARALCASTAPMKSPSRSRDTAEHVTVRW